MCVSFLSLSLSLYMFARHMRNWIKEKNNTFGLFSRQDEQSHMQNANSVCLHFAAASQLIPYISLIFTLAKTKRESNPQMCTYIPPSVLPSNDEWALGFKFRFHIWGFTSGCARTKWMFRRRRLCLIYFCAFYYYYFVDCARCVHVNVISIMYAVAADLDSRDCFV